MFDEDTSDIIEESGNVFRSIGEKIIEIVQRVRQFIVDTFNKIKTDLWKKKDDEKKLKKAYKRDKRREKELKKRLLAVQERQKDRKNGLEFNAKSKKKKKNKKKRKEDD